MVMKPFCVANLKMSDLRSIEESRGRCPPKFTKIAGYPLRKQYRVLFVATARLA
jgi:hypothetical protein